MLEKTLESPLDCKEIQPVNMLCRFVIAFLPRNKHLLISWMRSPSIVILEPGKIKSVTVSIVSPSICHEVMGLDAIVFSFCMLCFKQAFSLSSFTFIKTPLVTLYFLPRSRIFNFHHNTMSYTNKPKGINIIYTQFLKL